MSESNPQVADGAEDFSAGFLDTPDVDTLPPGATPDAKNCIFVKPETKDQVRAILRRRGGSRLTNPIAVTSQASVDGIWEFTRELGVGELIVMCNGALYKWDNISVFTALTDGGGFTPGLVARAFKFKNNLHVTDGTAMKRYDGTACFPVGFAKPTAAPALAAVAGPGVTGTYEGFAVWVDSVTGHMSSPSATSAAVVFANQQRQWTKPAGAPPANVTHWRIVVRRVDTFEGNFYITGVDQLVATATYTEAISDTARRDIGPLDQSNDVPPVFAVMEEFKGYRFGVLPNSSDLYISKQFDAESQHPKDVFPVGGRGDTKLVQSIRKFGEELALRKPTMTYRVTGDRLPFAITPVQSSLGGVSATSGQEVRGLWYDWDEQRGPYYTDLNSVWEPLADNQIKAIINTVDKIYLNSIESAYFSTLNLLVWAVPTSSPRKRTLLVFSTLFQRWLPPITGFEYTTLASFTTPVGALGLYFGDEWGRVYELFAGDIDGPPSGTHTATITAATAGTITVTAPDAFYTTGDGLAGMPVAVLSPAGGWQWVRVESNTGQILTLDTTNGRALSPVPNPALGTWTVVVGAIEWYWTTPWLAGKKRHLEKRGRRILIEGSSPASGAVLEVFVRYNRSLAYSLSFPVTFPSTGMVWGLGMWGVDVWGSGATSAIRKHRHNRSYFSVQLRWQNYYPNQPFEIGSYGLTADWQTKRLVASV
jgi:hypothetical protein